jgi:hypothetical protein
VCRMHSQRVRNVQDARGKLAQKFAHIAASGAQRPPERLHSGLQALHGAHPERVPSVAAALSSGAQCSCDKSFNWANLAGS